MLYFLRIIEVNFFLNLFASAGFFAMEVRLRPIGVEQVLQPQEL